MGNAQGKVSYYRYAILIVFSVLFLLTNGFVCQLPDIHASDRIESQFRKKPYLIYKGTNTEMTLLWQLKGTHRAQLKWGTDTSYSTGNSATTEYGSDHQHAYGFTGLKPGTKYYYRVDSQGQTVEGSFVAPPPADARKVKFMVYSDMQEHPEIHDTLAADMVATFRSDREFQTLAIVAGDLVDYGAEEADWDAQLFAPERNNVRELMGNLAFQACVGNHESYADGRKSDYSFRLFKKYLPYPFENHVFWSFDYGPAHFVAIDQFYAATINKKLETARLRYRTYEKKARKKAAKGGKKAEKAAAKARKAEKKLLEIEKKAGKIFDQQLSWLEKDLASSNKPWKFLYFHKPIWVRSFEQRSIPEDFKAIQTLAEEYGVSLIFSGHHHNYTRAKVNGVYHIITGGSGGRLTEPLFKHPAVIKAEKSHHFCKVEIDGNRLTLTAVKPGGEIIERFTMEK